LTNSIVPFFAEQDRHKLLVLTKSANVKGLLETDAQGQVIVGFSVNSVKVAKKWERKSPSPIKRLEAAKNAADKGYEVRLRIDPMVPIEGWKDDYRQLVGEIFDRFRPARITLGTLRGLQSTIVHSKDRSWVKYLGESSGWGKKIEMGLRTEMYTYIIGLMEDKYNFIEIAICKETVEMLERLGIDYTKIRCNCVA
jgi:spore photoproduct lyase